MSPLRTVIVGAGHRSLVYAGHANTHPDEMQIVGVVDPNPRRRQYVAEKYGFGDEFCFEDVASFTAAAPFADAVINGTMDELHVETTIPLLEHGLDVLLEKPIAISEAQLLELDAVVKRTGKKVLICHVLRYAPFYVAIRERLARGEVGQILNVQTTEHVSYHHMGVGFIRGKWNSESKCGSSMLMAKCCHDLDLITWMMGGVSPVAVQSFGDLSYFREDRAPEGAGTRCLVDCPIEESCDYSARKHYLNHPHRWTFYVWDALEHLEAPTLADKEALLKGDSPYGRCVWRMDNDVVDHQTVNIEFANGATASHNMVGGSARPVRRIHILGSHGEIEGELERSRFVIRHIDARPGHEYSEEVVDLNETGDMTGAFGGHGGGDQRLAADFVHFIQGREASISCTSFADSVNGHLIGFRADRSRRERRVVEF